MLCMAFLAAAPEVERAPVPADAVALALQDISTLPVNQQPYTRYIWIPDGDAKKAAAVSFVINATVSQEDIPRFWKPIAGNRLVRVNLEVLSAAIGSRHKMALGFQGVADLWNSHPNSYFRIETSRKVVTDVSQQIVVTSRRRGGVAVRSGPLTITTAKLDEIFVLQETVQLNGKDWFQVIVDVDGKQQIGFIPGTDASLVVAEATIVPKLTQVREFAEHTNANGQATQLQLFAQSNNPILRYDQFMVYSMRTLDGGLYYKWINIPKGTGGQSDLDALHDVLGSDKSKVEALNSDKRAAIFFSGITAKPRMIEVYKGLQGTADINEGRIWVTWDVKDAERDAKKHPIRNLLEFKPAAHEVIFEWNNGTIRTVLYDGDGKLQQAVPSNIASDHTIPNPYTKNLEAGFSCYRCHAANDSRGVRAFRNDVAFMSDRADGRPWGADVFDDASDTTGDVRAVLKRLASMYSGNLAKPIRRSRNDLDDAIFKMTGGMAYTETVGIVSKVFEDYLYTRVTPEIAVKELGFVANADTAVEILNEILPPLPNPLGEGYRQEDPVFLALKVGIAVNRLEWEQAYVDAMNRTTFYLQGLEQEAQKENSR